MYIDIAQIPQHQWLQDATCWTRESRPILVSPSLGTSMAFERDGESWWTDGGIAIQGKCPASYRNKLEQLGRWQADPAQKLTAGVNQLIREAVHGARVEAFARPAKRRTATRRSERTRRQAGRCGAGPRIGKPVRGGLCRSPG